MDNLPKHKLIYLQVAGELAFLVIALPIYALMILPDAPDGVFPGVLPLYNADFGLLKALASSVVVLASSLALIRLAIRFLSPDNLITDEVKNLARDFTLLELTPVYLAAGIGEEFLFRVVCVDLLGLIAASVLFALVHIAYWKKPLMLFAVFVLALLLGVLYILTESFALCALVHFAYNMLVTREVKLHFLDD